MVFKAAEVKVKQVFGLMPEPGKPGKFAPWAFVAVVG